MVELNEANLERSRTWRNTTNIMGALGAGDIVVIDGKAGKTYTERREYQK
jgi:hypothetical protein